MYTHVLCYQKSYSCCEKKATLFFLKQKNFIFRIHKKMFKNLSIMRKLLVIFNSSKRYENNITHTTLSNTTLFLWNIKFPLFCTSLKSRLKSMHFSVRWIGLTILILLIKYYFYAAGGQALILLYIQCFLEITKNIIVLFLFIIIINFCNDVMYFFFYFYGRESPSRYKRKFPPPKSFCSSNSSSMWNIFVVLD